MDASYDALRALTSSKLRWGILESLERPKRLSDLRRIVGANAPNTSTKAKDLQRLGLIDRDNGDYYMTRAGKIVHVRLSMLMDTLDALYAHRDFWFRILEHLPEEMILHIHHFKKAILIKAGRNDLEIVKRELLRYIQKAEDELLVVLPVKCEEIENAIERKSKSITTRLVTLHDDPNLHYGLISSKSFTVLFTDMLDMALISKSPVLGLQPPSCS
jgi:predicted transcriptional regulator